MVIVQIEINDVGGVTLDHLKSYFANTNVELELVTAIS